MVFMADGGQFLGRRTYRGAALHGPYGGSVKRKLCMVPCHICHIYGIWRSRGGACFEVINWGKPCKPQGGDSFNGEREVGSSLYVILLC